MREALEQLALLRFARLIVGQLGSISSLSLIPTIHSFSSLRVQNNTHGVLANPDSSQAMAPSKQKRTHTVFRASSAHRSTSTSKPRFVGEKVRLGNVLKSSSTRNKDNRCANVYSVTNSKGFVPSEEYFSKEVFSKELRTYRIVARNMIAYNPSRINVGSVALQDKADEVVVSPLYVVFSTDTSKLMPEYLVHFLKSKPGLDQIAFQSIGTVRNNLKYKALCQMELRIPSLGEQQARLNTLREIQLQIDRAESQIAELDQLVKSQFVEMFGTYESWKSAKRKTQLDSLCWIGSSKRVHKEDYVSDGVPFFRTKEIVELSKGKQPSTELYIAPEQFKQISEKNGAPNPGDLLITAVGTIGVIWVVDERTPFYFKDGNLLWLKPKETDSIFLKYLLEELIASDMGQLTGGTAYKALTIVRLSEMEIVVPPLALQQKFAAFVSQVDKSRFVRDHEINFR